jgi:hypothetical protein
MGKTKGRTKLIVLALSLIMVFAASIGNISYAFAGSTPSYPGNYQNKDFDFYFAGTGAWITDFDKKYNDTSVWAQWNTRSVVNESLYMTGYGSGKPFSSSSYYTTYMAYGQNIYWGQQRYIINYIWEDYHDDTNAGYVWGAFYGVPHTGPFQAHGWWSPDSI